MLLKLTLQASFYGVQIIWVKISESIWITMQRQSKVLL